MKHNNILISEDDSMWSSAHGLHSGPWLGPSLPDEEAKDCMACNKSFTTIRRRVRNCDLSLSLIAIHNIKVT